MVILLNILMFAALFMILKMLQIFLDFAYTTYKSITIHKSLEHAFHPPFSYRFKYGLKGDIMYFIAGVLIAFSADEIRALIFS